MKRCEGEGYKVKANENVNGNTTKQHHISLCHALSSIKKPRQLTTLMAWRSKFPAHKLPKYSTSLLLAFGKGVAKISAGRNLGTARCESENTRKETFQSRVTSSVLKPNQSYKVSFVALRITKNTHKPNYACPHTRLKGNSKNRQSGNADSRESYGGVCWGGTGGAKPDEKNNCSFRQRLAHQRMQA